MSATAETDGIFFELDRFERTADDRLELSGRWYGIRGRRFVRPTLTLTAGEQEVRALADLEHKPWAAEDGADWHAAFACEATEVADAQLAVAPDIAVKLPSPGKNGASPQRLTAVPVRRSGRAGSRKPPDKPARSASPRRRARPKAQPAEAKPAEITPAQTELAPAPTAEAPTEPPPAAPRPSARQQQVERLRQELRRLREELDQSRAEAEEVKQALARRNSMVRELREALTERVEAQKERVNSVQQRQAELSEREAELTARQAELTGRGNALDDRQSALDEREAQLQGWQAELEARARELSPAALARAREPRPATRPEGPARQRGHGAVAWFQRAFAVVFLLAPVLAVLVLAKVI